ncbi:MAG: hypothetical protein ABI376_08415 [Caulobacteraceae bacterium]
MATGLFALCLAGHAAAADADPYAPLRLLDGKWEVTGADGKIMHLENRCARTGLFYACEQAVGGKSGDLVVYLPRDAADGRQTYVTQTLMADGAAPGSWFHLTIDGDRWIYSATGTDKDRERTLNRFDGKDHIRFDIQTSKDGVTWTTTQAGAERREPAP